jgi:hypothetical protein
MDAYSIFRACSRRWYVFVPLLAIVAGLSIVKFQSSTPEYTRTETFLVAAPTADAGASSSTNPLTSTGNALAALVQRLSAPDIELPVTAANKGVSVSASSSQTGGTILILSAQGSSAAGTEKALSEYSDAAQAAFTDLQQRVNASPSNYYQLVSLSGGELDVNYPGRNQGVGLIALGGIVAAALLTQLVDALLLRRGRREADERTSVGSSSDAFGLATSAAHGAVDESVADRALRDGGRSAAIDHG